MASLEGFLETANVKGERASSVRAGVRALEAAQEARTEMTVSGTLKEKAKHMFAEKHEGHL